MSSWLSASVSVPSAGIVYFLPHPARPGRPGDGVSVPSAGIVYFLQGEIPCLLKIYLPGFSPLSGDCLFLTSRPTRHHHQRNTTVSVPSAGIVYFLQKFDGWVNPIRLVSVPSAGIVYFLRHNPEAQAIPQARKIGFSPLSGDCLFLTKKDAKNSCSVFVSVPSAGIVYFLPYENSHVPPDPYRFSPLSGDCLFLTRVTAPASTPKSTRFSPLSGDCLFLTRH